MSLLKRRKSFLSSTRLPISGGMAVNLLNLLPRMESRRLDCNANEEKKGQQNEPEIEHLKIFQFAQFGRESRNAVLVQAQRGQVGELACDKVDQSVSNSS